VFVNVAPTVFADAIGRTLRADGFIVHVGTAAKPTDVFDVAILGEESAPIDVPITLVVGTDSRIVVHSDGETGVVSAAGPCDLSRLLRVLFMDQAIEASAS
jgi:hypothetical protein